MHAHFLKLKQNLELTPSFDQVVQARHAAVRSAVPSKDSKLIGSLQRKTRIQPLPEGTFDIDILVILGEFERWVPQGGVTAAAALADVYSRVQESDRYSKKNPQQDAPAVSLQFADRVAVELIPAYLDNIGSNVIGTAHHPKGRAFWIPKSGGWELADYDHDAAYITQQNTASSGYLVPTIKMLKAIKRIHFPYLKSFALEILAAQLMPAIINFLQLNNQPIAYPRILGLFFHSSGDMLAQPLWIPGSHTSPIVLDPADVAALQAMFNTIATHIDQTSALSDYVQPEKWRTLLGDAFPATLS
jgi:hypothetical protein